MISLADVNALAAPAFTEMFGEIAEHSPWVARNASGLRPFASREAVVQGFTDAIMLASHEAQLALIRAHPDLAARAKLTTDSAREQAGAGLSQLSAAQFQRFMHLNQLYRDKFDFPFIFAVKSASAEQILQAFAERINHSPEDEFQMALQQICRIIRFRIEERVSP
jgi:2-oxo-4-hydroxy-4-carboxy-5-ureidoimidazoline decarboxylase